MTTGREPDLKRALRPVPTYERAVREVSRMFADAGIRHALVGALGANAYRNRPRTTEDISFLVGDEAFETHRDREFLKAAVQKAVPACVDTLERLFGNVDRNR